MRWNELAVVACLQQIRFGPEVAAEKLLLRQREIGQHQLERSLNSFKPQAGVFTHDMHLENAFFVMMREGLVIRSLVFFRPRFRLETDGHRGAEHGQPLLQDDDSLLVQEHQRPLDGGVHIADLRSEQQVACRSPRATRRR